MSDKYKMFKNFMCNELQIDAETIRVWVRESVEESVKKILNSTYGADSVELQIENIVSRTLGLYYDGKEKIKKQVLFNIEDKIASELVKDLVGKVEIKLNRTEE